MSTYFNPVYRISPHIIQCLTRIEKAREKTTHFTMDPTRLLALQETVKLQATHYSTMIEGNRLNYNEVKKVIANKNLFIDRNYDENEVMGYYAALTELERYVMHHDLINEKMIQTIHALVLSNGQTTVNPTPYRNSQNLIKDVKTGIITYIPPEAADVPSLIKDMIQWINENNILPCPIVASIAHYQFVTIHPYFDGNGRTARLLMMLILNMGGYTFKNLYTLEEYYIQNLEHYYQAISVGHSRDYYNGRQDNDITACIEYFVEGMACAFENTIEKL